MIKIADIYVSISGYLLQQINIHQCKKNIQHSMLDHLDFNDMSIEPYKREIFPTLLLAYGVYITHRLK